MHAEGGKTQFKGLNTSRIPWPNMFLTSEAAMRELTGQLLV